MRVTHARLILILCVVIFLLIPASPASATGFVADYVLGQGGSYTTNAGTATSTGLATPQSQAIDPIHHRLFVVDDWNHRVLVYNLDSSDSPLDATADFVLGQTNMTNSTNATTQSTLSHPRGVAYDSTHDRLFVSDYDNNRVVVFDVSSITNGQNASFVLGQPNFTSATGTTSQNGLARPGYLSYDSAGQRLFVPDTNNNRIVVYDVSSISNGQNASWVLGQTSFTAAGYGSGQSGLGCPVGSSYDPVANYLYETETCNNRVLVFAVASITNGMNAAYVLGQSNYAGGSPSTTQSGMNAPTGVDATGPMIYVTQPSASRVTAYSKASLANGMNAFALYGQTSYTSSATTTTQMGLNQPQTATYDESSGKLFVADSSNHRILMFVVASVNNSTVAATVDPSLVFAVSGRATTCNGQSASGFQTSATATTVGLGHVSGSSLGGGGQDLSVSTNAANGFSVYLRTSGTTPNALRDGSGHNIADVPGSNASPGAAPVAGTSGFGYTTNDVSTAFTSNTWAKLTNTNAAILLGSVGTFSKSACVDTKSQLHR